MELRDVINNRRSIRHFKMEGIEEAKIDKIIESGIKAPSAKNSQPWLVVNLKGKRKNKVAEMMLEWCVTQSAGTINLDGSMIAYTAEIIKEAPVLLLIFRKNEPGSMYTDLLSIGAFIENMALTAVDNGLGSLWIADIWPVRIKLNQMYGNADCELISGLLIGKPNEEPAPRPRKNKTEIMIDNPFYSL